MFKIFKTIEFLIAPRYRPYFKMRLFQSRVRTLYSCMNNHVSKYGSAGARKPLDTSCSLNSTYENFTELVKV